MPEAQEKRTTPFLNFLLNEKFHFGLIALGALLRFKHFLENRSLWLDETYVALGILSQNSIDIFTFQPFNKTLALPPCLFLFTEKLAITLFGPSEYAFRLFPFIASIAALFLFYSLLKKKASPQAIPIALGLFALNEPLVYYASEVKQYSAEVMIALALFLLADSIRGKTFDRFIAMRICYIGLFVILSSYASIFLIIGIGGYLLFTSIKEKKWLNVKYLLLAGFICMSFFYYYFQSLEWMRTNPRFFESVVRTGFYTQAPIFSIEHIKWFGQSLINTFANPGHLGFPMVWAVIFIVGAVALFKKDRPLFMIMIIPFFLAVGAGFFLKFPLGGRFILFLTPVLLFVIAEGIVKLFSHSFRMKPLVCALIICFLFFSPLKTAANNLIHSRDKSGMRPAMQYLKSHMTPGDEIYINNAASWGYTYYLLNLKMAEPIFRIEFFDSLYEDKNKNIFAYASVYNDILNDKGEAKLEKISFKIAPQKWPIDKGHQRTWVLFMHSKQATKDFLLKSLNLHGNQIDEFHNAGSNLFLFDMSKANRN